MRALIVDDDPQMRGLLETVAESHGLVVTACGSAEDAWEKFQTGQYELVVLDWMLPGMDGIELCRRMRADPRGQHVAILIVTARRGPTDLQAVLDAGASDYIAKPADPEVIGVGVALAIPRAPKQKARA
ncbi:MAG: DNA-binding response OmpR family regulator, partial [Bradymonadia bacterium]